MKRTEHNRYPIRCLFPMLAGVLLSGLFLIIRRSAVSAEEKTTLLNTTQAGEKSIDRP